MLDFRTDGKNEKEKEKEKHLQEQQQQRREAKEGKVEGAAAVCLCACACVPVCSISGKDTEDVGDVGETTVGWLVRSVGQVGSVCIRRPFLQHPTKLNKDTAPKPRPKHPLHAS